MFFKKKKSEPEDPILFEGEHIVRIVIDDEETLDRLIGDGYKVITFVPEVFDLTIRRGKRHGFLYLQKPEGKD